MKPIVFDEARGSALAALAKIRGNDGTRGQMLELVDAMLAGYQARSADCTEVDLARVRAAAEQMRRLRSGLTDKAINSVGLFLP